MSHNLVKSCWSKGYFDLDIYNLNQPMNVKQYLYEVDFLSYKCAYTFRSSNLT
jgi:hypothetical protein